MCFTTTDFVMTALVETDIIIRAELLVNNPAKLLLLFGVLLTNALSSLKNQARQSAKCGQQKKNTTASFRVSFTPETAQCGGEEWTKRQRGRKWVTMKGLFLAVCTRSTKKNICGLCARDCAMTNYCTSLNFDTRSRRKALFSITIKCRKDKKW